MEKKEREVELNHEDKAAFAARLRKLRRSRGWRQRELAAQSGLGASTIAQYETGEAEPTLKSLRRLAKALGTTVAYLAGETDDSAPPRRNMPDRDVRVIAASLEICAGYLERLAAAVMAQVQIQREIEQRLTEIARALEQRGTTGEPKGVS